MERTRGKRSKKSRGVSVRRSAALLGKKKEEQERWLHRSFDTSGNNGKYLFLLFRADQTGPDRPLEKSSDLLQTPGKQSQPPRLW